eukprot:678104-Prymnesium_polylepis.1
MKYLGGYNVSVAFANVTAGDVGTNKPHKHLCPHMRRTIPNRNKNAYDKAVSCGDMVSPNVIELRSLSKKHNAIHMTDYHQEYFDDDD